MLYGRTHLAALAEDPDAGTQAFTPFALWALSAASATPGRLVPAVLSRNLPRPGATAPWARFGSLRRELDAVIALAGSKGILPRDLALFIHGVHGAGKLRDTATMAPPETAGARESLSRLRTAHDLNGPFWAVRLAHLLADLDRPESALVLLDKVRMAAKGAELTETAGFRMTLQRDIDEQSKPALDVLHWAPATMAVRAAIDDRVRREASATLMGPDVALVTETGLDPASVRRIIGELLDEYAESKQWDRFNALARLHGRQFGGLDLPLPKLAGEELT